MEQKEQKNITVKHGIWQILAYVAVNILISAATMLLVLIVWERRSQPVALPCIPQGSLPAETNIQPDVASIPPLEQEVITIKIIYGAAYVNNEQVVFERVGQDDLELQGWWFTDEDANRYNFTGQLKLKPGAELFLNSRSGSDTPLELFWNRSEAVWRTGETARLYDPQGNLRAEYTIP